MLIIGSLVGRRVGSIIGSIIGSSVGASGGSIITRLGGRLVGSSVGLFGFAIGGCVVGDGSIVGGGLIVETVDLILANDVEEISKASGAELQSHDDADGNARLDRHEDAGLLDKEIAVRVVGEMDGRSFDLDVAVVFRCNIVTRRL